MQSQANPLRQREDRRAQLRRAATARASIAEPHLLRARISKNAAGDVRLRLEPLEAPTLAAVLRERGPLGPKAAVTVVAGVARAIDALERSGLAARNVVPDRVLLDRARGAVLAEYGMPTKLLPLDRPKPDPLLAYRAPEEREGRGLTPRASVYSLGAMLLAALTGEAPPERISPEQERRGRDLPPTLGSVIARAMSPAPGRRYENAIEMARAAIAAVRASERLVRARDGKSTKRAKPVRVVAWSRPQAVPTVVAPTPAVDPDQGEAAERRDAERDRRAAGRAEKERRAAEAAERKAAQRAEKAAEKQRRAAEAADRRAVERAKQDQLAAEDAERKAARAAERKRARAARRPKRDARDGHRVASPAQSPQPAHTKRRGAPHPEAAARQLRKRVGPAAASKGNRSRRAIAIAAVGLGAAGIAAVALAPSGTETRAQPTRIANGELTMRLPAGWQRTNLTKGRFGSLSSTLAASSSGAGRPVILTGTIGEPSETTRALRRLAPAGTRPVPDHLGRLEVARYDGLRTRPGIAGTGYVLNTTGPSVLIVCEASGSAGRAPLRACARVAASLRLTDELPVSLAAARARRPAAYRALAAFGAARIADRRRIAKATVAADQADAAGDLQANYYEASRRVQATGLPGTAAATLVTALAAAGDAYGKLADAVSDHDQPAYDRARAQVLSREAALWKVLPTGVAGSAVDQP